MTTRDRPSIWLVLAALAVIPLFAASAFGLMASWTLRQHACQYDPFREWSEIALFGALLGGAVGAAMAGFRRSRRLLGVAVAVPALAAIVFGLATWRHSGIETTCVRRTLPQAVAACGLVPSQITVLRVGRERMLVVHGQREARLCLSAWANWQSALRVQGEDL